MGQTSKKLHRTLTKSAARLDLPTTETNPRPGTPSIEKFIDEGLDPVHAVYVFLQHLTSNFSELVSQLREMKKFVKIVAKAEEEYMPSGPPMSPLTTSYFTCWAFYDLRFDGTDTLASCLIEANNVIWMNSHQLHALKLMTASRMGIYEHVGVEGPHVMLRELVTEAIFSCHVASGYLGRPGELWYVRLLPPLPDLVHYHVAFTTPYILTQASKQDWTQFLKRGVSQSGLGSDALHNFLKYGPGLNYWNEFVLKSYHHSQSDAIFLAGIPDLEKTLPHA
ncbi:MAG: hypothetical protein AB7F75_13440 [Planctomycetota bacterium]